jgi:hypothetical protein
MSAKRFATVGQATHRCLRDGCRSGVAALACCLAIPAAQAQTMDEMRAELKALRAEVDQLRHPNAGVVPSAAPASATPAPTLQAPVPDPRTAARVRAATAAASEPGSAIPGGILIPGTTTSVHLYGIAEAHAIHDVKQSSSPDIFTDLSFQPLNSAGGQTGRTQFTAETSRIGFESSTPSGKGIISTKIEADFYAYGPDNRNVFRLRHAYGEYDGWLVGQTWSTFMDVDDLPETVDFNGPIGAPFSRRAMVRYAFGDATRTALITLAAEDPVDQFGGGSANERLPELVARMDKSFAWGAVNLRALAHEKRSSTQTKRGYGFAVGGNYKFGDKDSLMGQYTLVNGDVDQLYGSNGYAVDAQTGAITFDKNQGLVIGYAHVFSDKLRGNIATGFNRGRTAQASENRTLEEAFLNLIYSPAKDVDLGGEWIYGSRRTFSQGTGTLSRFDLMARYSF